MTKRIYLAKKIFLLRLFISILTGWLLFFASEDFWKIGYNNTDSKYLLVVILVILIIITFFMLMEIQSLINYKRVYDRVAIVLGFSLIISFNIGVFFMPDVLVGILDNSDFINKNEDYNKNIITPLEFEKINLEIIKNKITKHKTGYKILLDKTNILFKNALIIKVSQNYLVEENPNIEVSSFIDDEFILREINTLFEEKNTIRNEIITEMKTIKNEKKMKSFNQYERFINGTSSTDREWKNNLNNSKRKDSSRNKKLYFFFDKVLIAYKKITLFEEKISNKILELEKKINEANNPIKIREWLGQNHKEINSKKVLIEGESFYGKVQYHSKLLIFQTFLAMFIGIFMQLLIQNKTVTESI